ncbi:MAG: NHL repeat-containing protein, partial [Bryobacteraceae bacterium]
MIPRACRSWLLAVALAGTAMAQTIFFPLPARLVGHTSLSPRSSSPNLVEGRELYSPQCAALDFSSTPPALYVADTGNNRVLGWRNAAQFGNGAYADIVIGQPDRITTLAGASRTNLNSPVAVVVDAEGNLYVADAGNNRILRFPKPFQQLDRGRTPIEADMVLGQADFSSNRANRGGAPAANTIALSTTAGTFRAGLVFDGTGNLWFSDAANHRVLRYPADALRAGAPGPDADLVLGQSQFTTNTALAETSGNRVVKTGMRYPSGLALDPGGRLYVADALSRVLVFAPPFASGMSAARIMGVVVVPQGQQPPPAVNDTGLNRPEGIFMLGRNPGVVDTGNNRLLLFARYEDWPPEATKFSPTAQAVIGQPDMNTGRAAAGAAGLNAPVHAVFSGTELFIVDSGNHRVVVWPQPFSGATRVLGQISFDYNAANLIEGRELYLTPGTIGPFAGSVALDTTSSPPRLYIADTFNNRILGFRDAFRVKPGDFADIVIGQPDRFRSTVNYPSGDARITTRSSLFWPTALAVDSAGNLWVADSGN